MLEHRQDAIVHTQPVPIWLLHNGQAFAGWELVALPNDRTSIIQLNIDDPGLHLWASWEHMLDRLWGDVEIEEMVDLFAHIDFDEGDGDV